MDNTHYWNELRHQQWHCHNAWMLKGIPFDGINILMLSTYDNMLLCLKGFSLAYQCLTE